MNAVAATLLLLTGTPCTPGDALRGVSVTLRAEARSGSGTVFVDAGGVAWVLTASHVVGTAKVVEVRQVVPGPHGPTSDVSVYAVPWVVDGAADIALLRLGRGVFTRGASARIGPSPGLDAPILHCGTYRGTYHHSVAKGSVQWVGDKHGGYLWDRADVTLFPGSSGGGVFDERARFVGVLTHGTAERVGHYVPVRWLRTWSVANKVAWLFE